MIRHYLASVFFKENAEAPDNALARTAQFVGAAVASLLVVGPLDVIAWQGSVDAIARDALARVGAFDAIDWSLANGSGWALGVLAVLLTPAALVWVTRLFIQALRSSM